MEKNQSCGADRGRRPPAVEMWGRPGSRWAGVGAAGGQPPGLSTGCPCLCPRAAKRRPVAQRSPHLHCPGVQLGPLWGPVLPRRAHDFRSGSLVSTLACQVARRRRGFDKNRPDFCKNARFLKKTAGILAITAKRCDGVRFRATTCDGMQFHATPCDNVGPDGHDQEDKRHAPIRHHALQETGLDGQRRRRSPHHKARNRPVRRFFWLGGTSPLPDLKDSLCGPVRKPQG